VTRDPRELGSAWRQFQRHGTRAPAPDLAPFVDRYSLVEWDYAEPYRQMMVPYPHVHLTLRTDRVPEVHGVATGRIVRVLDGSARMLAITFRPGGFRTFLGASVSTLTDRTVPVADIPGLPGGGPDEMEVAAVERWLRAAAPAPDPTADWAASVVARIAAEPGITRVDLLAERCGCSVRRLQRVFAEYVGVGPKWVIRRYRLHEVTERMARGDTTDWAGLAVELGYADQAHFIRDFAAMFGEPPTYYVQRY
jgi:AraC-like DNA-binding protein